MEELNKKISIEINTKRAKEELSFFKSLVMFFFFLIAWFFFDFQNYLNLNFWFYVFSIWGILLIIKLLELYFLDSEWEEKAIKKRLSFYTTQHDRN